MNVGRSWFSELKNDPDRRFTSPVYFGKPEKLRERRDRAETEMKDVFKKFTNDDLEKPFIVNWMNDSRLTQEIRHPDETCGN
jgi:hypothetical protein